MTREDFENYLVLEDSFQSQCNLIASIFSEVDRSFRYADGWMVHMPYETCSGYKEPGYIFCICPFDKLLHIPFKYMSMTEDELKKVVKDNPEDIRLMVKDSMFSENDFEGIFDDECSTDYTEEA